MVNDPFPTNPTQLAAVPEQDFLPGIEDTSLSAPIIGTGHEHSGRTAAYKASYAVKIVVVKQQSSIRDLIADVQLAILQCNEAGVAR